MMLIRKRGRGSTSQPLHAPYDDAMDDIRDRFIEKVAAGKRFVDIGGLWGMVNEKATVAAAAGASP